jgi:hypothetical protein
MDSFTLYSYDYKENEPFTSYNLFEEEYDKEMQEEQRWPMSNLNDDKIIMKRSINDTKAHSSNLKSVVVKPEIPKHKPRMKTKGDRMNLLDMELKFLNEDDEPKMNFKKRRVEVVNDNYFKEKTKNNNLELFHMPKNAPTDRGFHQTEKITINEFLQKTQTVLSHKMLKDNYKNMIKLLGELHNRKKYPLHEFKVCIYNLEKALALMKTDDSNKLEVLKGMMLYYYWTYYNISETVDLGLISIPQRTRVISPNVIDLTKDDESGNQNITYQTYWGRERYDRRVLSDRQLDYKESSKSSARQDKMLNHKEAIQTEWAKYQEKKLIELGVKVSKSIVFIDNIDGFNTTLEGNYLIANIRVKIPVDTQYYSI